MNERWRVTEGIARTPKPVVTSNFHSSFPCQLLIAFDLANFKTKLSVSLCIMRITYDITFPVRRYRKIAIPYYGFHCRNGQRE